MLAVQSRLPVRLAVQQCYQHWQLIRGLVEVVSLPESMWLRLVPDQTTMPSVVRGQLEWTQGLGLEQVSLRLEQWRERERPVERKEQAVVLKQAAR